MGNLADGAAGLMGFGTNPAQSANSALNWGAAATGLDAAGALFSGIGGYKQAAYQASVAANNAKIAGMNAENAMAAGGYAESLQKLKTGQEVGAQLAAQGASGVDVSIGSPAQVRASTEFSGALDAAMIHYNAAKEAFGEKVQQSAFEAQAKLDRMAAYGSFGSGVLKAGSTLLSGASSLSAKAAQFKLSGARKS